MWKTEGRIFMHALLHRMNVNDYKGLSSSRKDKNIKVVHMV